MGAKIWLCIKCKKQVILSIGSDQKLVQPTNIAKSVQEYQEIGIAVWIICEARPTLVRQGG